MFQLLLDWYKWVYVYMMWWNEYMNMSTYIGKFGDELVRMRGGGGLDDVGVGDVIHAQRDVLPDGPRE